MMKKGRERTLKNFKGMRYTHENDWVLDQFLGSGNTLVLDHEYIFIEKTVFAEFLLLRSGIYCRILKHIRSSVRFA